MLKIRFTCDNKEQAKKVHSLIYGHPGVSVRKPQQGTNPKYADDQKWFIYADLEEQAVSYILKRVMP